MRRKVELDGQQYSILAVPFYPQGDSASGLGSDLFCFPCSLKMVIDYWTHPRRDRKTSEANKEWPLEDITEKIVWHETMGAKVHEGALESLNEDLYFFELDVQDHSDVTVFEDPLADDRPVVALYDDSFLQTGSRGDMGHAVVVIGVTEGSVITWDPYRMGPLRHPRPRFEEAWAIEPYNTIQIQPSTEQQELPAEALEGNEETLSQEDE